MTGDTGFVMHEGLETGDLQKDIDKERREGDTEA